MKALIYARQSSGKDDLSESVEAQIANCKKLAAKEKLEIIGVFRDLNTSGETYPIGAEDIARVDSAYKNWVANQSSKKGFRSGLGEVLQLLGDVNFVLVNELTRLYRPINGSFLEGHINHLLKENNVKLLQVQGGAIDLNKFDQQLITTIKNQILYDDLQKKRQNSINAFRNKRDSGKICCGALAFGLRSNGQDKFEAIPEYIEIIKFIYDRICEYKSYSSIVRDCNERWSKLVFFYESTIYKVARQPLYAGYQYNTACELIKNIQIAGNEIISFDQWQKVQKIIGEKRREHHKRAKKHWLPLSRKIYCGECGSRLICDIDHGKIYYLCKNKDRDRKLVDCRNSRIRFESGSRGEPSLYDAIFPLLSIALIEKHRKAVEMFKMKDDISKFEIELNNLQVKERKLFDMFTEGLASEEQLKSMLVNHKKKRNELSKKIMAIKASNISGEEIEILEENILVKLFNDLATKSLSPKNYENLLNDAAITATVFRDRVDFQTKFGAVTIPRIQVKTRFWMPAWEIELKTSGKKETMTFDENTKIRVTYITGEKSILADMGALKIQSR